MSENNETHYVPNHSLNVPILSSRGFGKDYKGKHIKQVRVVLSRSLCFQRRLN